MTAARQDRYIALLKWGAGLAVILWGLSKLVFAGHWAAPYENAFYAALPVNLIIVYVLGLLQVGLGIAIIRDFYRRPAAYIAVVMALVSLIATLITSFQPGNPVMGNPAPLGIKLVWFYFNPIALKILLVAAAEAPDAR